MTAKRGIGLGLFVLLAVGMVWVGATSAPVTAGILVGGGGIPIEPQPTDCSEHCAPFQVVGGGVVCNLADCGSFGGDVVCLYACPTPGQRPF